MKIAKFTAKSRHQQSSQNMDPKLRALLFCIIYISDRTVTRRTATGRPQCIHTCPNFSPKFQIRGLYFCLSLQWRRRARQNSRRNTRMATTACCRRPRKASVSCSPSPCTTRTEFRVIDRFTVVYYFQFLFSQPVAPCGLRGCKNGPDPFPGRMSYKATKPGLAVCHILACLPARRRPQGLVIIGVCLSVRTVFVRKISQERVHGSPPNLVGGTRG